MKRKIMQKTTRKIGLFADKILGKENEGLEAFNILLGALLGVLAIILLWKALDGTLPSLWDGLISKFKSTLGI